MSGRAALRSKGAVTGGRRGSDAELRKGEGLELEVGGEDDGQGGGPSFE